MKQALAEFEERLKYIEEWAHDAYECGQGLDIDDYREFVLGLKEDNMDANKILFDYWFRCFEEERNTNNELGD